MAESLYDRRVVKWGSNWGVEQFSPCTCPDCPLDAHWVAGSRWFNTEAEALAYMGREGIE